jgi:ABC-type Zn uptake system ZnuABC Zn-binding protein ZnuA
MITRRFASRILVGAAMAGWGASGCRRAGDRPDRFQTAPPVARPLRAVVSTAIVAELVRDVGGDGVEVVVLLPAGEPMGALERTGPVEMELMLADLVVVLGFGQEAVLAPSLARAAEAGAVICELAAGVPEDLLLARPEDPAQPDPHVWLDPRTWREAIGPIEDALTRLRPEAEAEWRRRAHLARFHLDESSLALERVARDGLPPEAGATWTRQSGLRYLARAAGVPLRPAVDPAVDPDQALTEAVVKDDDLERLPLDCLQVPGQSVISGMQEYDLATLDGLRGHALDLLLRRYQ